MRDITYLAILYMRKSLIDLTKKTIIWKYNLPKQNPTIDRSLYTTDIDFCFSISESEDLARIIYNSVIEYAFTSYEIKENSIENLHAIALARRLKFNPNLDDSKSMQLGFFGETLLYVLLCLYFKANPLVSKGYFYNPLENAESKGFDSFHLVEDSDTIELWFGEVKFYQSHKSALDSVLNNIEKNLSDEYLMTNLYAIQNEKKNFTETKTKIGEILDDFDKNPNIILIDILKKYDIKLVYPILILADELESGYDESITSAINHIIDKHSGKGFKLGIGYSILFIFIPVNCAKDIKLKVLEWIKAREQLLS